MTNEQKWAWEALERVIDKGETRDRIEEAIILALQNLRTQAEELRRKQSATLVSLSNGTF